MKKSLDFRSGEAHNEDMETAPLPYPGYEVHVEGMSEDANEARNARNTLAWTRHQQDITIRDIDAARDQLVAAEARFDMLTSEIEWLESQMPTDEEG